MQVDYILQVMFTALSYYFFNNEFFMFSAKIQDKKIAFPIRFFAFLLVYLWFVMAALWELPLVINWLVFLIILGLLVRVIFHFDILTSYTLSMFCTITGLAINILCRSFMALSMHLPLNVFDNTMTSIKQYPIILGFFFMGCFFWLLKKYQYADKLKLMLQNHNGLVFFSWVEGFVYIFLIVQLLAYSQTENNVGVKLWGIKAAGFSIIALIMANIYTLRVARLHLYMDKQHTLHKQLAQDKEDVNKLWELAYTDMLTNCNNRSLFDKRIKEYAGYGSFITLGFVDLNGLKIVNDQYGHLEGDVYLQTAAHILCANLQEHNCDVFRYGGDEFVVMSNSLQEMEMQNLLQQVNEKLLYEHRKNYTMSISYGIVYGNSSHYDELLKEADERMYRNKRKHYEHLARS